MTKLKLAPYVFLCALFFQNCKKDTVTATTTTTATFQASIDDTTWTPDTVNASITYNAAAKTRTFYCIGTKAQKQVLMSITLNNAAAGTGFATGTYYVDATPHVTQQYNRQTKDPSGNYVFVPHGTVTPGSGVIVVTSVDSVRKVMTGIFNFISRKTNYDGDGNVVSINIANISSGVFNSLPYALVNN